MPERDDARRVSQAEQASQHGYPVGALVLAEPDQQVVSTPPGGGPAGGRFPRLRQHLGEPFFYNAYALILNTGVTGLLGVVFWVLAARHYSDPDVGRGSALISALTLLSGIVGINVTGTLNRFIPQAGGRTIRLLLIAYLASAAAIAVLTAGFLLTLDYWGPSFELLRDPSAALWFLAAVVTAGVFTVQDGALIGLRSSVWVPVENTIFGLGKIILVVLFAASAPFDGVYLAWVIPMALLVLPVNALIFGRLAPRHTRLTRDTFVPPSPRQVGRFFAADYIGALFVFGTNCLVPLLVAANVATHTFAYFFVVWITAGMLNLIPVNLAASMTVEGVHDAHKLAANARAAVRRAVGILVVAAVVVSLVAPYGLNVLGRGYLDAVPLMQALAFAALPRAVVDIWIGVLRARSMTREIARVQILSGVLVIGGVALWLWVGVDRLRLPIEPITGVGLAVLAGQTLLAVALLPRVRRFLSTAAPVELALSVEPKKVLIGGSPADPEPAGQIVRHSGEKRAPAISERILRPIKQPVREWLPAAGILVLFAAALLLFLWPLRWIDPEQINGYGIISVIPVASLIGLSLLVLTFFVTLTFRRSRPLLLGVQLAGIVCCLHGVSALVEPLPRFPTTWVHLGFVEFIGRTGTILPYFDGRFSWPGFFAFSAFLSGAANWRQLLPVLELVPLISNLLYLLPLGLLLRNLRGSWQAKWFAAWLFVVANWVGQDYFSPQGLAYWLYLVFVAILVSWFRPIRVDVGGWMWPAGGRKLWKTLRLPTSKFTAQVSGELPARLPEPRTKDVLLLLILALFTTACVSHQLTPFLMLAVCTGLVLVRRCVVTGLPVLLAVILIGWLSYLTVAYWSGHLHDMLAGVGELSENFSSSVAGRAAGSSVEHHWVLVTRIAFTIFFFALAALGALRRRRRGIDDRVVLVLLSVPFLAVAMQSYGGEIAMRVYFFALPAACVLAAFVWFPEADSSVRSVKRFVAAAACGLVLVGGFLVARYGNEQYERMRPGDLAAMEHIYQQETTAQVMFLTHQPVVEATSFLPIGYRAIERVTGVSAQAPRDPTDIADVTQTLRGLGPSGYLMTSRSQEHDLELGAGYPPGWGDRFRERMAAAPEIAVVTANEDAVVYALKTPVGLAANPVAEGPPGTRVGATPWTPIGAVFLGVLVLVLLRREWSRLRLDETQVLRLRPLTWVAVPFLVGLMLVVFERLVLLTP